MVKADRPASDGPRAAESGRGFEGLQPRHPVAPSPDRGEGTRLPVNEPPAGAVQEPASHPGYPAYPGYGSEPPRGEAHLLDYVRVLYKRRWLAGTALVAILLLTIVYTFTRTPLYQARVQLQIDYADQNVVPFRQVTENQVGWDTTEYFQTQYRILQSRTLAKRTLDAAKLWNHPALVGPAKDSAPKDGAGSQRPAQDAAPAGPAAHETPAQTPVIDAFLGGLRIAPVRNSRLVDVEYTSPDPQLASAAANTLAGAYIEQNLEIRFVSSREASTFLGKQIDEQRKAVEASEQALQRYREKTDSVSLEDKQNITVQKLADLNAAVTKAKTDRLQKESVYNQVRAIQNDRRALDTFPAILANSFVQQLKAQLADLQRQRAALAEKYGDKHPRMVELRTQIDQADAKLQGEVGKVVESIRNEYLAAQEQERSLTAALEQQKGEAMALSRKGIDYGVLQRDATTNRQIFDSLLQRAKETQVSGELKASNVRVVDPAILPRSPVSPNKRLNLLLGLFGGAFFAGGLAFLFEYLDNRVKSPEEIEQVLGLPFLGLVPALKGNEQPEKALLHADVPGAFAEAFRAIRTNVLFSSADEGGRSIVVTSTGPGEGKTLVASNLAVALAQAEQRVLLVDADMRKPRVHKVFGFTVQPGLSNVLVGDSEAIGAIAHGPVPNLHVLAAGLAPPNPAELLASRRFKDFLHALQEHFDWVVVDAPPVMAVTDAAVVAHIAHGVVFVVGCEQTSKHTANAALQQLEKVKARFLGGILNKVDVDRHQYYYSTHYRKSYAAYYHSTPPAS